MHKSLLVVLFALLVNIVPAAGQDRNSRIPAKFMFSLGTPGTSLELLQPQQIRYDRRTGEYYLADSGHNRVIILNAKGFATFELRNEKVLQCPKDVAVDSNGLIYVLGTPLVGKGLSIFDYNGDYIGPFQFHGGPDTANIDLSSLVIDDHNQMYLTETRSFKLLSYDLSGNFKFEAPLFKDLNAKELDEQMLGGLTIAGDFLYLPVPMQSTVYCLDKQGNIVKTIGYRGGGDGELSFPVSASVDMQGNYLILDKHRCSVVRFDSTGKPNGEFGGMGLGPGWFYHPISMLVDPQNRAWVVQGLNNLVQVMQLPGLEKPATEGSTTIVVDQ